MRGVVGIRVMLQPHTRPSDPWDWAKGHTIASVVVDEDAKTPFGRGLSSCAIRFADGSGIRIVDDGQSCCERRYMTTDDELTSYVGATLVDIVEKNVAPEGFVCAPVDEYGGEHEVCFVEVQTSKGFFTLVTHNEHNGYYGGFALGIEELELE